MQSRHCNSNQDAFGFDKSVLHRRIKAITMTYFLFNRKHFKEYVVYGSIAGVCHSLTVWYYLGNSNSGNAAILFIGSIFFMFVIMVYAITLTKRRRDQVRTWGMLISGQITVLTGVAVSVIIALILCSFYRSGSIELIFVTATFGNYGAGAFMSAMIAYALKPDQTVDRTPEIFEELVKPGININDGPELPVHEIRMEDQQEESQKRETYVTN